MILEGSIAELDDGKDSRKLQAKDLEDKAEVQNDRDQAEEHQAPGQDYRLPNPIHIFLLEIVVYVESAKLFFDLGLFKSVATSPKED